MLVNVGDVLSQPGGREERRKVHSQTKSNICISDFTSTEAMPIYWSTIHAVF